MCSVLIPGPPGGRRLPGRCGQSGSTARWTGSSLSFGDFPGLEYTLQLFADHLIHAWDLARAIGADEGLDAGLVASCASWFEAVEDAYRSAGAIAARPPVPGDADAQTVLLARFGRRA